MLEFGPICNICGGVVPNVLEWLAEAIPNKWQHRRCSSAFPDRHKKLVDLGIDGNTVNPLEKIGGQRAA